MAKKKKLPILNINLVPKDPFFESTIGRVLKWALTIGRYIVIFTELIVIISFITRFSLDRRVTDLNGSINQKKNVIQSFGELESNVRTTQFKIDNYKQVEQQTNIAEIFPALSEITPNGVVLDQLTIKSDQISFTGFANSQSVLNTMINNIQYSPKFTNVEVGKIVTNDSSQGLEFSINANVNSSI